MPAENLLLIKFRYRTVLLFADLSIHQADWNTYLLRRFRPRQHNFAANGAYDAGNRVFSRDWSESEQAGPRALNSVTIPIT